MDALWNLEDKLKISTKKSIILLVCSTILIIIVCFTLIFLKLKTKSSQRNKIASHDYYDDNDNDTESMIASMTSSITTTTTTTTTTSKCGMIDVRSILLGSPCWSVANKWCYENSCNWELSNNNNNNKIIKFNCLGGSKLLPVWQRPILMGVKCKLPRYSGLILYDERGTPLPHRYHHHHQRSTHVSSSTYQGVAESTTTTMLKDLL